MCLLKRAVSLLLLLIPVSFDAVAQQRAPMPKTLLWRISGKGLKKPSFLYGTIHLSDKRLFNFDEHLYQSIEQTDGFAMELNPDEMVAYFINNVFDQAEDEDDETGEAPKLRDVLRDEEFQKYSPALSKRLNKPAGNITTRDIIREKNRWVTDYASKGSMPTFVDAYLYNLARRQGKWVGGIEDLSDQLGALDEVDRSDIRELSTGEEGSTFTLTDMITAYLAQDISRIDEMVNGLGESFKDALLLRRNVKMARRMDSLMAFRSMLFAVGAAHLPGDSGVISLLRKRGFTVEPVTQGRKIAADEYVVREVEVPWQPVADKTGLYTISMPGNPVSVKMSGLLDMQFFFDLFNMRGYMTTAIASSREFRNLDSTADVMARSMFPGQRVRGQDVANDDGLRGREYISHRGSQHMQLRIYTQGNVLYITAAIAMKRESLNSPDIPRFFNSFRATAANTRAPRQQQFADSAAGLRFTTPALIERNRKLESGSASEGWKISAWSGQDIATGAYIMLIIKGVDPGKVISNDTLLLEESYENLRSKNRRRFTRQKLNFDGYPALRIEGRAEGVDYKALTYVRGGQHVMLMVVSDTDQAKSPGLQAVFNSVRLLPFSSRTWQSQISTEGQFSSYAPGRWTTYAAEEDGESTTGYFRSYDTASSTSYLVLTDTLGTYASYRSDSVFWAEQMRVTLTDGDSMIYSKRVGTGAISSREILVRQDGSNEYLRVRKMLHGNVIYSIYAQADRGVLFSANSEKLFSSFSPGYPPKPFSITVSKTTLLLTDLAGRDSAKIVRAYYSLADHDFVPADLPLLRNAFFKSYDTSVFEGMAANELIGRKIAPLMDAATVQALREAYPKQTGDREVMKMTILNILADAQTKESYAALTQIWTVNPPLTSNSYDLYSNLTDSLTLLKTIFPTLLQLAGDTAYGPLVAALGQRLVDSGHVALSVLKVREPDFIRSSDYLEKKSEDSASEYYYVHAAGLMELLSSFNTPGSDAAVEKYYRSDNWYLRLKAVELLVKKNKVDTAAIARLAGKRESRMAVYKSLQDAGKEALFPVRFRNQQSFAGASIYEVANEDIVAEIKPLVTTVAEYGGRKCRFYLYEISYGEAEEKVSYLGIAGAYDVGGNSLMPEENITQVLTEDAWEAGNKTDYNRIFRDWLKTQGKSVKDSID